MCHGDRFRTRATEEEPTAVTDSTEEMTADEPPERDREDGAPERPTPSVLAGPVRTFRRVKTALSR